MSKQSPLILCLTALLAWGCQQGPANTTSSNQTKAPTPTSAGQQMSAESPRPSPEIARDERSAPPLDALKGMQGKEFEVAYLSQMIAHHQGGIDMSERLLKLSPQAETRQEAEELIKTQAQEIQRMTELLKERYQTDPVHDQQALMRQSMPTAAITDDGSYLEQMKTHHQIAVQMSELAETRAEATEVKEIARKIIDDRRAQTNPDQSLAGQR